MRNAYQDAIDEALVVAGIGVADRPDSSVWAKQQLNDLINWHITIATDPRVNGGYRLVKEDLMDLKNEVVWDGEGYPPVNWKGEARVKSNADWCRWKPVEILGHSSDPETGEPMLWVLSMGAYFTFRISESKKIEFRETMDREEAQAREMAKLAGWPNCRATVDICRRLLRAGCTLPGQE